jgi:hypothetical protein
LPGLALAAGAVALLGFADGGFWPAAWRAATVAFLASAALGLVLRERPRLTCSQVVVAGALAALVAWTSLSALWSLDEGDSLLEAQRTLVYLALVAAAAVLGGSLLAGTLVGITAVCAWAVGQRLLVGPPDPPDVFEGTLLQEPIGYANGLGGLAAIGLVVALSLLARERRRPFLVLLLALFAVTLVWTGSRAGIVAAAVGGALGLALALGRLRLARLVVGAAGLALALALALPAGSLADDLARHGGDRPWYWHVAWEEVRVAPLAGQGAGTFHLSWLELRPIDASVQDAHSLYLEMLAELGAVGLALLLLALAPPLVVALRGARFPAAAAGYVAFLFHAGVDWDWELPAVTVAGLLCGAQLLRPNAQDRERENVSTGEPAKGVS